jgi:hypothetical protein
MLYTVYTVQAYPVFSCVQTLNKIVQIFYSSKVLAKLLTNPDFICKSSGSKISVHFARQVNWQIRKKFAL